MWVKAYVGKIQMCVVQTNTGRPYQSYLWQSSDLVTTDWAVFTIYCVYDTQKEEAKFSQERTYKI